MQRLYRVALLLGLCCILFGTIGIAISIINMSVWLPHSWSLFNSSVGLLIASSIGAMIGSWLIVTAACIAISLH